MCAENTSLAINLAFTYKTTRAVTIGNNYIDVKIISASVVHYLVNNLIIHSKL